MQVFVQTLTGRKIELNTSTDNPTALTIKQMISRKEGIPEEQQRLIYGGKQLNEKASFNEFNIKAGSIIHLVLALRGGIV